MTKGMLLLGTGQVKRRRRIFCLVQTPFYLIE